MSPSRDASSPAPVSPASPAAAAPTAAGAAAWRAADDLEEVVGLAVALLSEADPDAWDAEAGPLEWSCWETVEHLGDDLFAYAAQLGPARPSLTAPLPLVWSRRRPSGPSNVIHADRAAGPAGLLQVLEACGGLLAAMVRVTPPATRSHHVFGASDPAGFAAMGLVETLVHTDDLAQGLGLTWHPPAGPCARVLARLFPDAPTGGEPWPVLLWATGRAALPGRPRLTSWRWDGTPRGSGRQA
ncbi:hypothetical protein ACFV3R_20125 [Streptomyces sp. NPDC059740]|uniref:hypothetical protein n=1 Tax=Streptomyces sp. NPDC059740 TaxID=3346926 RepID=UPI0036524E3D